MPPPASCCGDCARSRARCAAGTRGPASIPDEALRADALRSLKSKRASTDGAALFWTLPDGRSPNLLRLLVAFEVMADFLDNVSERGVQAGPANGVQLHVALSEALDPGAPVSAYYRHHPWREDGGYLRALVGACRERCARLPHYGNVRSRAIHAATLARMLGLNHEPDPSCATRRCGSGHGARPHHWGELAWFESTAAASGWLTVLALLALAAGEGRSRRRVACVPPAPPTCPGSRWWRRCSTATPTRPQDAAGAQHSYIAHYPCADVAVERVCEIVREAARRARALPDGARHTVIVACMVAMYLSKDSSRTPQMRASTRNLAAAGGSLSRLLLPVLRVWRVLYSQRDE